MKKTCVVILSLILFNSLNAYSYGGHGRAKWWKDPTVAKELNLTKDQVDRIEAIFKSDKDEMEELNGQIRRKQSDLRLKIEDPNSSRDEVMELNDQVTQLKTRMKRLRLDMLLKIRDVLTTEQRQGLKKIRSKRVKNREK